MILTPNGHIPVLLEDAVALLNIRAGLTYVDVTAGGGSHLQRIAELSQGRTDLVGIDRDQEALEILKDKFKQSDVKLHCANFAKLHETLAQLGISTVTGGILADLGVSSKQLNDPTRGFSFLKEGPLDMRMDISQTLTASYLVNNLSEEKLAEIIFKYGEERESRSIARNIVQKRPLSTTLELAEVIANAGRRRSVVRHKRTAKHYQKTLIHPATRTFQALRIAVNSELESLKELLEQSRLFLAPGARLVIITFHSLEDRLVKQFFRRMASTCLCPPRQPICNCGKRPEFLIITRKPLVADEKEVLANIRSRSAKLRAGEKLA